MHVEKVAFIVATFISYVGSVLIAILYDGIHDGNKCGYRKIVLIIGVVYPMNTFCDMRSCASIRRGELIKGSR